MTPLVSILFPVYNTAAFLREAIDSILNQSFTDFELIVLNDCSPDNAEEILDSYSDSRIIRYRGEQNVGLANVLNVGLKLAKGKYIARMDSDDISLPNRLQIQVDYLNTHPNIDLVSVGMQQFGDSNTIMSYAEDEKLVYYNAFFFSPILHASAMWRKDIFMNKRLFYHQEMVPAEDYDLWERAIESGVRMINLPDILYKYRMFSNTQANRQTDKVNARTAEIRHRYWHYAITHPWFFCKLKPKHLYKLLRYQITRK